MAPQKRSFFWFRRDLRLEDNAGLYHALKESESPVIPVFIFDANILDELKPDDPRVTFIYQEIESLQRQLGKLGSGLRVEYGKPVDVWESLIGSGPLESVFLNRDYEPYAKERDGSVKKLVEDKGGQFRAFKDHVIFEAGEVLKDDGDPYTVFTPYKRKWLEKLHSRSSGDELFYLKSYPTEDYFQNLNQENSDLAKLEEMGFEKASWDFPERELESDTVKTYAKNRDFPGRDGTTRLGLHLRFGTISIRRLANKTRQLSETFLSELIWRDFYSQILACFPHVVDGPFREKYAQIPWRDDDEGFEKWCQGKTGYPLVDAGMRQLNQTGYMHNRVRMVTASFLTKHLLINWQRGEAYFAEKLLDYDLASNNGGWQWAAGCGTDAAPYFRIFNPTSQLQKFDPDRSYVKEWIPELDSEDYPDPMVEHKQARERCLSVFKKALS